jgi:hypothetical protein
MKKHYTVIQEIKSDKNTTTAKLINIIQHAFPLASKTENSSDIGTIHPDTKSKGKAVLFTWKHSNFKLSEALRVTEKEWCSAAYISTPLSNEAEAIIKAYNDASNASHVTEQVITKPENLITIPPVNMENQANEEIKTEAAVS